MDISFADVYVGVFYLLDVQQVLKMDIANPAPDTRYGWLSRGMCHALEIAWLDQSVTPALTPDATGGFND